MAINNEDYRGKHVLIIHHNDLDGICSAAIIRYFLKKTGNNQSSIGFHMTDYRMEPPFEKLREYNRVCIVDFSYIPEHMRELINCMESPSYITWIDHHKTAESYNYHIAYGIKSFCCFSEVNPKAGCELTWQYFLDDNIPDAVHLLGNYDSNRQSDNRSICFLEGLKSRNLTPLSSLWDSLFTITEENNVLIEEIIKDGNICVSYRQSLCNLLMENACEAEFEGMRILAVNTDGFGSLIFGDYINKYPMVATFVHKPSYGVIKVALYSSKTSAVDCGAIAQKHGGGGHRNAAGFFCKSLPWKWIKV